MMRNRILGILVIVVTLGLFGSVSAIPGLSPACLLGAGSCPGTVGVCGHDCPGFIHCVDGAGPFVMCECEFGFCETVECPPD